MDAKRKELASAAAKAAPGPSRGALFYKVTVKVRLWCMPAAGMGHASLFGVMLAVNGLHQSMVTCTGTAEVPG